MVSKILWTALCLFCISTIAWGGSIKTCVGDFTVAGAVNKDELKTILQTLLLSRLNSENIVTQEQAAGAEVMVTGSYIAVGKVFSIDAVAKNISGTMQTRAFVQGEGSDELIPAVGKLAKQLGDGIVKNLVSPQPVSPSATLPLSAPVAANTTTAKTADTITSTTRQWISQRLPGAFIGMALSHNKNNNERRLFLAGTHSLQYYLLGTELKQIALMELGKEYKVLGIDTADLNGDGEEEIYLTIISDDSLASQVWQVVDGKLKKMADGIPLYFRAIALAGGAKKLYGQHISVDDDFFGEVGEVVKKTDRYELVNLRKLPRFGYLYNFNQIRDRKNNLLNLVNKDGNLIVTSEEGEELWRSSARYGGSELFLQRYDNSSSRKPDAPFRWTFLEQRIIVTKENELIIPQNSGSWVIGNSRSYNKNSMVTLQWNGAELEERSRSKESQSYLADFSYDELQNELILLEIVKKEGLLDKGASIVEVRKMQ